MRRAVTITRLRPPLFGRRGDPAVAAGLLLCALGALTLIAWGVAS